MRSILTVLLLTCTAMAETPMPFAAFHSASKAVLNDPHDLAFGPDGKLYIADKLANQVVVMDPVTLEIVSTIGDGMLFGAHDVSFGPDGKLYVAATSLSTVVVFDRSGNTPIASAQLGPFSRTEGALAHSNGQLYVTASGTGQLFATQGDEIVAVTGGLTGVHDVAEAPDGTVWVADTFNRRLVQYTQELEKIAEIKGPQYGFVGPRYMDFTPDGLLIVADQDAHSILKINPVDGAVLGILGTGTPGMGPNLFDDPEGVATRGSEFFFADSDNNRVVKYIVALN